MLFVVVAGPLYSCNGDGDSAGGGKQSHRLTGGQGTIQLCQQLQVSKYNRSVSTAIMLHALR